MEWFGLQIPNFMKPAGRYKPLKNNAMGFEIDKKYIIARTALIVIAVFWFSFIGNKILAQNLIFNLTFTNLILIVLALTLFILFLKINSIHFVKRILIFKNIFGFTLKKIDLDSLKGKKIIYSNLPVGAKINIQKILGKKYERSIEIKLSLKDGEYKINGQILSNIGLKMFNEKIRN